MAELVTKRHPIRAAIWGFIAGLGVLVYLVAVWPVIGLDNPTSVAIKSAIVVGGVMILAVVWAMVAPAKKPKGSPPGPGTTTPPPAASDAEDDGPSEPSADEPAAP